MSDLAQEQVLSAFLHRETVREKYETNPQILDMIWGTSYAIAQALDEYAGLPSGFMGVIERHIGTARDYTRFPAQMAVLVFGRRIDFGPKPEEYLKMADSVKGMPLEYAQPLLDVM